MSSKIQEMQFKRALGDLDRETLEQYALGVSETIVAFKVILQEIGLAAMVTDCAVHLLTPTACQGLEKGALQINQLLIGYLEEN